MAPNLPDMPVEIFLGIIDNLQDNQARHDQAQHAYGHLLQLRQVCRTIEIKTRKRFGQDYFDAINMVVRPNDLGINKNILADELFRGCVRKITISLHVQDFSCSKTQPILDGITKSNYSLLFRRLLQRVPDLKRIALEGPPVGLITSCNARKVLPMWEEIAELTFNVLATQEMVHLEDLQLGRERLQAHTIPAYRPSHDKFMITAFANLTSLSLLDIEVAHNIELSDVSQTITSLDMLASFLEKTPKLQYLEYRGEDLRPRTASCLAVEKFLSNLQHVPRIKELRFGFLWMTDTQLIELLHALGDSLERIQLEDIRLGPGSSWRAVLFDMRKSLNLKWVNFMDLYEEKMVMVLREVNPQRPAVIDQAPQSKQSHEWYWAVALEARSFDERSERYRAKESDIIAAIADGWAWISPHQGPSTQIVLDKSQGDDIEMWLTVIEHQYELEH